MQNQSKEQYVEPTLVKQQKLAEITEGLVSGGVTAGAQGG